MGVGSAQMSTFYLIVAGGMLAGVVGSLILLDINDIRRPVMIALACFAALGAWLEIGVGMQTRPRNFISASLSSPLPHAACLWGR